uniref:Secreted protein n=1 Tax=Arundo donax TaxID=35708 RepID=A0A0A9HHU1_ARUDO
MLFSWQHNALMVPLYLVFSASFHLFSETSSTDISVMSWEKLHVLTNHLEYYKVIDLHRTSCPVVQIISPI